MEIVTYLADTTPTNAAQERQDSESKDRPSQWRETRDGVNAGGLAIPTEGL